MPQTRALIGAAGRHVHPLLRLLPALLPVARDAPHRASTRTTTACAAPSRRRRRRGARREDTLPVWLHDAGYDTIHIGKYLNGYGLRQAPDGAARDGPTGTARSTRAPTRCGATGSTRTASCTPTATSTRGSGALPDRRLPRQGASTSIAAHAAARRPFFLSLAFVRAARARSRAPARTHAAVHPRRRRAHAGRFADAAAAARPGLRRGRRQRQAARTCAARAARRRRAARASPRLPRAAASRCSRSTRRSGAIVDALAAHRPARPTRYILFTSDNGFFQGEHRIAKGKFLAYEPSTRVPLLIRGPGIPAGTVSAELVANVDLAPTILDAAGATADLPQDGRSLLPYARDGSCAGPADPPRGPRRRRRRPRRRPRERVGVYYAIRTARYLYVKWRGGARELYDLRRDPLRAALAPRRPALRGVAEQLSLEVKRLRGCEGEDCQAPVPTQPPTRRAGEVPSTAPAGVERPHRDVARRSRRPGCASRSRARRRAHRRQRGRRRAGQHLPGGHLGRAVPARVDVDARRRLVGRGDRGRVGGCPTHGSR